MWVAARLAADGRVRLMLRLAAEVGLRRGEIARLHRRDLLSGPSLLVHGKGGKERIVPIGVELAAALAAAQDWVFPNGRGGHLHAATVGTLCSAVMPPGWSLHHLRHRFACRAYNGSHDLRAVQELLGHASPAVTQRYVSVDADDLRRAMMCAS